MTMAHAWNRIKGRRSPQYERLPLSEKEPSSPSKAHSSRKHSPLRTWALAFAAIGTLFGIYEVFSLLAGAAPTYDYPSTNKSCDTIDEGYRCSPETTHFWGQYSLWFSVPSAVDVAPPRGCSVTFASVLSRHGGRDPTASKTLVYGALMAQIQNTSTQFPGKYAFLKDYKYTLGADQLTDAGRQEMVNSGANFYGRYSELLETHTPFVRSSGQARVVESANKWLQGYAEAGKQKSPAAIDLIIPEGAGINNTLSHELCTAFEDGPLSTLSNSAQALWAAQFVPPIQARTNAKLGTNLTGSDIISFMDMCPFDTLTSPTAQVSDFCHLFTVREWHQYDYYQSLGKYYGYGAGNPLGPTQGVGYVNELLARLTEKPVQDHTNTNRTLDSNPKTFPLDRKVYADFSHDNDMSAIFAALGLYNSTQPLSNTTIEGTDKTNGFSAAWTVPFAARMYVEKLACDGNANEEFVRVIVNDRVMPLEFCGADEDRKCKLSDFVESQGFARGGGLWNQCFAS